MEHKALRNSCRLIIVGDRHGYALLAKQAPQRRFLAADVGNPANVYLIKLMILTILIKKH